VAHCRDLKLFVRPQVARIDVHRVDTLDGMKHSSTSSLVSQFSSSPRTSRRPIREAFRSAVLLAVTCGLGAWSCGGSPVLNSEETEPVNANDDDNDDDVPVVPRVPDGGVTSGPEDLISEPEPQRDFCGDGNLSEEETCDDGNTSPGDGCTDDCSLEDGFICPVVGAACEVAKICGDTRQVGSEQCDDGNVCCGDSWYWPSRCWNLPRPRTPTMTRLGPPRPSRRGWQSWAKAPGGRPSWPWR
jgi:cysteine-rich repeat protein